MTRSADRLVAARNTRAARAGVTPEYGRALDRAHALSKKAGTPTEHRAAAVAFRDAAAKASDGRSRSLHTALAENHDRMALAEEQGIGDLHELNAKAAEIHNALAHVVSDPKARRYHLDEKAKHQRMAKEARSGGNRRPAAR